jgi:phosphatidylserine/phosphatidylglycerophosphate/cardiolipin synthase-like enzyme
MIKVLFLVLFALVYFSPPQFAEESNAILIPDNGLEMFQWDLDFVRQAQASIDISAVFLGGEIATQLFQALDLRLSEVPTLQVYLLTSPYLLEPKDWEDLKHLQGKYPNNFHVELATTVTIIFPDISGIDNHVKMFIVDEKYFSTGGTNLDYPQCSEGTWTPERKTENKIFPLCDSLPAGMRDQDIVGKGPLARELRETFYKLYALWEDFNKTGILKKDPDEFKNRTHYFPVSRQGNVERFENAEKHILIPSQTKLILSGPHQAQNAVTNAYVRLIEEAKEEIVIGNLYFNPREPIFKALLAAVNRGVKLTVVTNGISDITPKYSEFFCWANRMQYVPVLYGKTYIFWDAPLVERQPIKNTALFEYHVRDILYHKKVMMVDQKKAIVGSYNLGTRSDMGDYEMVVELDSPEVTKNLLKVFAKDLHHSRRIDPREAREWYFDPLKSSLAEIQKRFHGLL